jgi:methionyl-tRNA formyltransferase
MKVTLLCTDARHPVNDYLVEWIARRQPTVEAELVRAKVEAKGGNILFLVSCSEIITAADRARYDSCLVLHASDLPKGRGWSPHIWELIEGRDVITLSLLEAEDKVDSGRIWTKLRFPVPKHALWNEINHVLFQNELKLLDFAVDHFGAVDPKPQSAEIPPSYYRKRRSQDSEISAHKSISEQFDLIRVCDPNRFPAYFDYLGQRYLLKLEKCDDK